MYTAVSDMSDFLNKLFIILIHKLHFNFKSDCQKVLTTFFTWLKSYIQFNFALSLTCYCFYSYSNK